MYIRTSGFTIILWYLPPAGWEREYRGRSILKQKKSWSTPWHLAWNSKRWWYGRGSGIGDMHGTKIRRSTKERWISSKHVRSLGMLPVRKQVFNWQRPPLTIYAPVLANTITDLQLVRHFQLSAFITNKTGFACYTRTYVSGWSKLSHQTHYISKQSYNLTTHNTHTQTAADLKSLFGVGFWTAHCSMTHHIHCIR